MALLLAFGRLFYPLSIPKKDNNIIDLDCHKRLVGGRSKINLLQIHFRLTKISYTLLISFRILTNCYLMLTREDYSETDHNYYDCSDEVVFFSAVQAKLKLF